RRWLPGRERRADRRVLGSRASQQRTDVGSLAVSASGVQRRGHGLFRAVWVDLRDAPLPDVVPAERPRPLAARLRLAIARTFGRDPRHLVCRWTPHDGRAGAVVDERWARARRAEPA